MASSASDRDLFDNVPVGLYRTTVEGTILDANLALVQMLGYPDRESLLAAPAEDVVVDPDQLEQQIAVAQEGVLRGFQMRMRRCDGAIIWVENHVRLVRDEHGQTAAYEGSIVDVTERRRTEISLRLLAQASSLLIAAAEYETTLDRIANLVVPALADWCTIYLRDDDGEIRRVAIAYADPAWSEHVEALRSFAPSPISPASRVAHVLSTGQPDLMPEIPEAYVEGIAQGPVHLEILRRLNFKSSMVVPLATRDSVVGAIAFFLVEPGRRYDERDMELAVELSRHATIAIENARLYHELKHAVQMRDDFLAAAAHDLNNPLTAAKALVQMLRRHALRAPTPIPDRIVLGLSQVETSITKMARLIEELRDVARMQVGRPLELILDTVDLVALVRQAVAEQNHIAHRHDILFDTDEAELLGVWDGSRIERVVANLLNNAIKYSPSDSAVVVSLARESSSDGDWAVLSVRDHGIGIPEADLPHIFERFHRGTNVSGRIVGSGIGLSGARQIVELHGGTIDVESVEGAGSTFVVRLPIDPADERVSIFPR